MRRPKQPHTCLTGASSGRIWLSIDKTPNPKSQNPNPKLQVANFKSQTSNRKTQPRATETQSHRELFLPLCLCASVATSRQNPGERLNCTTQPLPGRWNGRAKSNCPTA